MNTLSPRIPQDAKASVYLKPFRSWRMGVLFLLGISARLMAADEVPRVVINGVSGDVADNIRANLSVMSENCDTSLARLRRLGPTAGNEVDNALQAMGYYKAGHDLVFSAEEGSCWRLEVNLQPGEPVRLRRVDVRIQGDAEARRLFQPILAEQPLQSGDVLHQGRYEDLKSAISSRAVEYGYFSSRFTEAELAVYRTENLADITLLFDPGERFRFGELRVSNNTRLRDDLVQRMISLQAGQAYSSEALFDLRENLNSSRFFAGINIFPELGRAANHAIPVDIQLEPRPRHVYSAGLGFTTDTGPRLRVAYDDRYLNRSGHSLETNASFSTLRTELDAVYSIPLRDPGRETLQLRGGFLSEETDTYESDLYTLRANYLRELESGWLQDLFINYQLEDYLIGEGSDQPGSNGNSRLTILGVSYSRSRSDNPVFTTRGWSLFARLRGADDDLLSDTTFLQLTTRARHITSLGNLRLLSRVELGTTWVEEDDSLPATLRYFAGGDRSIRGYKYQALGPENEEGEVIGGRHSAVGSLEADFPVARNWRLAMFYDVGNAFSSFDNIDWQHTVGFGIRWVSPIGPIRVDLGHPVREGGVRLHITMGPDL